MKRSFLVCAAIALIFAGASVLDAAAQTRVSWNGVWKVPSRFTPSVLKIKAVTAKSFRFEINAVGGANMADISGTAKIRGNKAFFDDRWSKAKDAERKGCKLTFTNKGTHIDVDTSSECSWYSLNGAYFGNLYYKGTRKPFETDFVYLEVFPNLTLDRKFKTLVGKDYERFLDSFHQIYPGEDLDKFGAKVFSACVRGMCGFWGGIIMYDKKGNFWAAVLDDTAEDMIYAHYYTNAAGWTDKLPKTIDKWVTENRDINDGKLTVVFKNKK
jgi:hypothetical protein